MGYASTFQVTDKIANLPLAKSMLHSTIFLLIILAFFPLQAQNRDSFPLPGKVSTAVAGDCTDIDTSIFHIQKSPKGTYLSAKELIQTRKAALLQRFGKRKNRDSLYVAAKALLEESIVNTIVPFWYGTEWDFYGHTATPQKGTIACGYFVSTVMEHCGFAVNRYTVAQQAPLHEALTWQMNDSIQIFETDYAGFSTTFKRSNPPGLYFVGLDCHVGFLLYRSGELFFIHSSYLDPLCVVVEQAGCSAPFNATSRYLVAKVSTNKWLIDTWLGGTKVKTRVP
jgi:hypothetical protein